MPITEKPSEYFGNSFVSRKVLGGLLNFFNKRIFIERYDSLGEVYRWLDIPISYANRERFKAILTDVTKSTLNNAWNLNSVLPRMSMFIANIDLNMEDNVNKYHKNYSNVNDEEGNVLYTISPTPLIMDISLNLMSATMDDLLQMIEQIVSYFQPDYTKKMYILEGYPSEEITYTLQSIGLENEDEFSILDNRTHQATLTFETRYNSYYLNRNAKMIKDITINHLIQQNNDSTLLSKYELSNQNFPPVGSLETLEILKTDG